MAEQGMEGGGGGRTNLVTLRSRKRRRSRWRRMGLRRAQRSLFGAVRIIQLARARVARFGGTYLEKQGIEVSPCAPGTRNRAEARTHRKLISTKTFANRTYQAKARTFSMKAASMTHGASGTTSSTHLQCLTASHLSVPRSSVPRVLRSKSNHREPRTSPHAA